MVVALSSRTGAPLNGFGNPPPSGELRGPGTAVPSAGGPPLCCWAKRSSHSSRHHLPLHFHFVMRRILVGTGHIQPTSLGMSTILLYAVGPDVVCFGSCEWVGECPASKYAPGWKKIGKSLAYDKVGDHRGCTHLPSFVLGKAKRCLPLLALLLLFLALLGRSTSPTTWDDFPREKTSSTVWKLVSQYHSTISPGWSTSPSLPSSGFHWLSLDCQVRRLPSLFFEPGEKHR